MSPLAPSAHSARARPHGRVPFAFRPRFFVLVLIGLLWLAPAWLSPAFLYAVPAWDVLLLCLWIADLLRLPPPSSLAVRRFWPAPLLFGEPASVHLELTAPALLRATLMDEIPPSLAPAPPQVEIEIGHTVAASASYMVKPVARGDIRAGRVFVRYFSGLDLAERRAVADLSQTVRVLPNLEQARKFALYLVRSRQIEMEKRRRRQPGRGRDFEGLRDYRQGDELRDICWSATARRNQLTTRVYQVERSQTIWIVLDAGRMSRARIRDDERDFSPEKLDYAADSALSLSRVAIESGDRVGLLAYGRAVQQLVPPARGPLHLRRIINSLSLVKSEAPEANHARAVRTLLTKQPRRSLIVWLTDFAETATTPEVIEFAAHMTRRHLVVFGAISQPDLIALAARVPSDQDEMFRHAAAREVLERREKLLGILRRQGVLVTDIAAPALAAAIVNRYLDVKDRSLI